MVFLVHGWRKESFVGAGEKNGVLLRSMPSHHADLKWVVPVVQIILSLRIKAEFTI